MVPLPAVLRAGELVLPLRVPECMSEQPNVMMSNCGSCGRAVLVDLQALAESGAHTLDCDACAKKNASRVADILAGSELPVSCVSLRTRVMLRQEVDEDVP